MNYLIIFPFRMAGMNEYTEAQRANRYVGGKLKRQWQKKCETAIAQQFMTLHITKPVKLHYAFYEANQKRDLDNVSGFAHKVIQDALVTRKVLKNDGWAEIKGYSDDFAVDKQQPRIELLIEEVE